MGMGYFKAKHAVVTTRLSDGQRGTASVRAR